MLLPAALETVFANLLQVISRKVFLLQVKVMESDKVQSSGSDRNSPVRHSKLQKGESGRVMPCGDVVPIREQGRAASARGSEGLATGRPAVGTPVTPSASRPASVSTATANARIEAFEQAAADRMAALAARNAYLEAELEVHALEKKAEESYATARAIESDPAAGSRSSRASANIGTSPGKSGVALRRDSPKVYLTPEVLQDHETRAATSSHFGPGVTVIGAGDNSLTYL